MDLDGEVEFAREGKNEGQSSKLEGRARPKTEFRSGLVGSGHSPGA